MHLVPASRELGPERQDVLLHAVGTVEVVVDDEPDDEALTVGDGT